GAGGRGGADDEATAHPQARRPGREAAVRGREAAGPFPRSSVRASAVALEGGAMDGLMMDFQLTLPTLLRRAETYFGEKEIVTRLPDRSFHRYTYREMARRARQLSVGLEALGIERGDRVATLCW